MPRRRGEASPRAAGLLERWGTELPSATASLNVDLDALLAVHRLQWRHRKFARTTNLIEGSFVEERRRTTTLPRSLTEKSCLKLVYATLIRAVGHWQRITITVTSPDN